jgi:PilZ domain
MPSSARPSDRRSFTRYPCRIEVAIGWGSNILNGVTRDIALSGMFIEIAEPLWMRAEFTARLSTEEPIEVDCIVRRVEPGKGMGVEFKDLPEAEREQLELLVRSLTAK